MPKKIINVGAEPGNLNDGDTLREAFIKTQANFDELYSVYPVRDTALLDHGNVNLSGSIAKALADAAAAGGGTVLLGPGTFTCTSLPLVVSNRVTLRGVGKAASIIKVTGAQQGIQLTGQFASLESLRLAMPEGALSDGIYVRGGETHLHDIAVSGGGLSSWAINIESTNVCSLSNVRLGGSGNPLTGNGIIFQNSLGLPYNFGDSHLSKVDILLKNDNTTGIKFQGSDLAPYPLINNILMSQVEVIGSGMSGGCTGIHIHNAQRIVSLAVDLEQLQTAIIEEGVPGVRDTSNNVYIAVFAIGVGSSYVSNGNPRKRFFFGCHNLTPTPLSDGDVMVPGAIWFNSGTSRIWETNGELQFDMGGSTTGLRMSIGTTSPTLRPSSTLNTAQLTLGAQNSRGVECQPGVILPLLSSPISSPKEGTMAYYASGVVGANTGLYHLRSGSWIFIG